MNVSVHHLLQSCGVQCRQPLKTKLIMNSYFGLGRVIRTRKSCLIARIGPMSMIEVHTSVIKKSVQLENFNGYICCRTVCYSRKKSPRDLGSPGNRQLLLPQPFSPILVFHLNSGTPPHHYLLGSIVESLAPLSISLRLKLIAHPFACFVQFSLSRVVCFSTRRA